MCHSPLLTADLSQVSRAFTHILECLYRNARIGAIFYCVLLNPLAGSGGCGLLIGICCYPILCNQLSIQSPLYHTFPFPSLTIYRSYFQHICSLYICGEHYYRISICATHPYVYMGKISSVEVMLIVLALLCTKFMHPCTQLNLVITNRNGS